MKLASCKSALNPRWFTLLTVLRRWSRCSSYSLLLCGLFYEAICFMSYLVSFCSCVFPVLLALRLPRLGKRELILVVFVRLFDLCLFGFVGFLFLLVSGKGCGLWLWHSLDFYLTFSLSRNMKNIRIFYLKFSFLVVKFSVYLDRRVFVMQHTTKHERSPAARSHYAEHVCCVSWFVCGWSWLVLKCFEPLVVYFTDRSKAVVPVLV